MKSTRRTFIAFFPLVLLILCSAAFAQNRERFSISAKAGGVNTVVGHVMITRKGQTRSYCPAQTIWRQKMSSRPGRQATPKSYESWLVSAPR
jgi:hypothetical protein